jgi:hypothetical protein
MTSVEPSSSTDRYYFKHLPPEKMTIKHRPGATKLLTGLKVKVKKSTSSSSQSIHLWCRFCGPKVTVELRNGPYGPKTLCNPCGLQYAQDCREERKIVESNNLHQMSLSYIVQDMLQTMNPKSL